MLLYPPILTPARNPQVIKNRLTTHALVYKAPCPRLSRYSTRLLRFNLYNDFLRFLMSYSKLHHYPYAAVQLVGASDRHLAGSMTDPPTDCTHPLRHQLSDRTVTDTQPMPSRMNDRLTDMRLIEQRLAVNCFPKQAAPATRTGHWRCPHCLQQRRPQHSRKRALPRAPGHRARAPKHKAQAGWLRAR